MRELFHTSSLLPLVLATLVVGSVSHAQEAPSTNQLAGTDLRQVRNHVWLEVRTCEITVPAEDEELEQLTRPVLGDLINPPGASQTLPMVAASVYTPGQVAKYLFEPLRRKGVGFRELPARAVSCSAGHSYRTAAILIEPAASFRVEAVVGPDGYTIDISLHGPPVGKEERQNHPESVESVTIWDGQTVVMTRDLSLDQAGSKKRLICITARLPDAYYVMPPPVFVPEDNPKKVVVKEKGQVAVVSEPDLPPIRASLEEEKRAKALTRKMQTIVLPRFHMEAASLGECVAALRKAGAEQDVEERDPKHKGVPLTIEPGNGSNTASVALDLFDVPLIEALRYVTELAGVRYTVESTGVTIRTLPTSPDGFFQRTFTIPSTFWRSLDPDAKGHSIREILGNHHVNFPEGASEQWLPQSRRLLVKNTQLNLGFIEALVENAAKDPAPYLAATLAAHATIPKLALHQATLRDAVERIHRAAEFGPKHPALKISVAASALTERPLTLDLEKATVLEALIDAAELTGNGLYIHPHEIIIDRKR